MDDLTIHQSSFERGALNTHHIKIRKVNEAFAPRSTVALSVFSLPAEVDIESKLPMGAIYLSKQQVGDMIRDLLKFYRE